MVGQGMVCRQTDRQTGRRDGVVTVFAADAGVAG